MVLRYLAFPFGIALAFVILWLMWPSPISPVRWDEPPAPEMTGPVAPNDALRLATVFPAGPPGSARGVAVSANGVVYFGTGSGDIMRLRTDIDREDLRTERVAHITDDGIFDLNWIDETTLGIAAPGGLYSLSLTSLQVNTLSSGAIARAFGNITNLTTAPDGTVYFTDSSSRWDRQSQRPGYYYDMLENRPNGLVYAWDPETGQTETIRDRLYYPNGIEIAPDGQSIFVSETFHYMIRRVWIAGPRAGEAEVFAKNLPGLPAGLEVDQDGRLVVAMLTRRSRLLARVHRNPGLTRMLIKLPLWLRPTESTPHAFILRLDTANGRIIDSFHDPDSRLNYISDVTIAPDGAIWFGTSFGGFVGRFQPAGAETAED